MGVGLGSGGLSGEVKSKKGGEEARAGARAGALAADVAVVARQLEVWLPGACFKFSGCVVGAFVKHIFLTYGVTPVLLRRGIKYHIPRFLQNEDDPLLISIR